MKITSIKFIYCPITNTIQPSTEYTLIQTSFLLFNLCNIFFLHYTIHPDIGDNTFLPFKRFKIIFSVTSNKNSHRHFLSKCVRIKSITIICLN